LIGDSQRKRKTERRKKFTELAKSRLRHLVGKYLWRESKRKVPRSIVMGKKGGRTREGAAIPKGGGVKRVGALPVRKKNRTGAQKKKKGKNWVGALCRFGGRSSAALAGKGG